MPKQRVVLDSNVIVSGVLYPHSNPGKILKFWSYKYFSVAISPYILTEVKYTLTDPKILTRYHLLSKEVDIVIKQLENFCHFIETPKMTYKPVRDPKDSAIIMTAIASKAQYLVTGDKDLLVLNHQIAKVNIITPTHFLELISGS